MPDLNLAPHLKYSTILCCQNRDIFGIDRQTRYIPVHKSDQHVQGWNPTNIFSIFAKVQKKYIFNVFFNNQKMDKN